MADEESQLHAAAADVLTESIWEEFEKERRDGGLSPLDERNKRWKVPSWLDHQLSNRMRPSLFYLGPIRSTFLAEEDPNSSYLKCFFAAELYKNKKDDMDKCLKELRMLLPNDVRCWYHETYTKDLDDDRLLKIMFIDGSFIIANFIEIFLDPGYSCSDTIDMLLLFHNQIPLVILRTILKYSASEMPIDDRHKRVPSKLEHFSVHWSFVLKYIFEELDYRPRGDFDCLLSLYHYSFVRKKQESENLERLSCNFFPNICNFQGNPVSKVTRSATKLIGCGNLKWPSCIFPNRCRFKDKVAPKVIRSATKLQEGGVIFKKKKYFGDIKFRNGKLSIPSLDISDRKILSLLAFDEMRGGGFIDKPISNVVYFIAFMVITAKDLDLLDSCDIVERGDISNTEDILSFFGEVRKNVKLDVEVCEIPNVCQKINLFLNSRLNQWKAYLKNNYFTNPWTALSLMAAIVLLIMACLQTYFTVYPYYRPKK